MKILKLRSNYDLDSSHMIYDSIFSLPINFHILKNELKKTSSSPLSETSGQKTQLTDTWTKAKIEAKL